MVLRVITGLLILHCAAGIVISSETTSGNNFVLTGGNFIGTRREQNKGHVYIGNNCFLGANAVILGPVNIGDNNRIGAGCVITQNTPNNCTWIGNPAKLLSQNNIEKN